MTDIGGKAQSQTYHAKSPKHPLEGGNTQNQNTTRPITPRIQETSHRVNASAHLFRDLFDMMCLKDIDVQQSDKNLL